MAPQDTNPKKRSASDASFKTKDASSKAQKAGGADGKPSFKKTDAKKPWQGKDGAKKPFQGKDGAKKPWQGKDGDKKPWQGKDGAKKPWQAKDGDKKPWQGKGDKSATPVDYKLQRKMSSPHYEMVKRAKEIWNLIRERDFDKVKRVPLVDELFHLVSGKIHDVAAKHDASRVIQSLLKYGTVAHRSSTIKEMLPHILEMAKLQYGCFLVTKMLKYGSKDDRALIVKELTGSVVKIATHNVAATILECAQDFLQPRQLSGLKLEFYGKEFAYFKSEMEAKKKTLADVVEQSPAKKQEILTHVADVLNRMVDKQLLGLAFVQALMLEYLTVASPDQVNAMIPNIRDAAVALLATRAGAKVVVKCLSLGNAKDRKRVIKTLKDKVLEATNHISGYLVLLRVLDVLDDTVLVQKSVLSELQDHWLSVALHQNGSKVLLQLLSPLNTKYLGPDEIALLQPPMVPADNDSNELVVNYKKDPDTRRNELWAGLKTPIETMCAGDVDALLRSKSGGHVLFEVTKQSDNAELLDAVVKTVVHDETPTDGTLEPLFADAIAHKHLQRLIQHTTSVGPALLAALPASRVSQWAESNRGAYVLLAFLDVAGGKPALVKALKGNKWTPAHKAQKGTSLLLEKLELA
ncbi:hypothetical protein DYB25_000559 [Aphanomyces astaci]|uniref:PUM-HD domain-containing protein n=2 Tax=Aphanomyces astaci TaxID=112090 RepID=A0A397BBA2_APHAT|nr:hypothetical protein DYB25_000559 [Aphanomyces astaci]RHY17549.1 hypothetical protein DYB36_009865 [Aphanomyces astaci]RHY59343.1 hypothetical protein DYB34_006868 [Aphanomyces astaci]RHY64079.1 hypothetical protein DYB38_003365 [Aphanomyces astaci]RHY65393.1 hypothetical protein DYB30_003141 [Aphanomyces astaci]